MRHLQPRRGPRTLLALALASTSLVVVAPAAEAACRPICVMSGTLGGTNLNIPPDGAAFSWSLRFSGGYGDRGATAPMDLGTASNSAARFDGDVTSRQNGLVQASGTLTIAHPGREGASFVAIPMSFSGRAPAGPTSAVRDGALDTVAAGLGLGASAVLVDGTLSGAVTITSITSDEEDPFQVSLLADPTFEQGAGAGFSGRATTQYGHALANTTVDLLVDGDTAMTVVTDREGAFSGTTPPLYLVPHTLQARVLAGTPLESRSPTRTTIPLLTVTTTVQGPGQIVSDLGACSSQCSWSVSYGTSVTFHAAPGPHAQLTTWSGHCQGVGSCSHTVTTHVSVTATFALVNADVTETEPNDTLATADIVALPIRVAGALGSGDIDWYAFTIPNNRTVTFETFETGPGVCGVDTVITLTASNGSTIATDDDGGLLLCSRLERVLLAGSYRIRVEPYGQTTASDYRLHVTSIPAPPSEIEPNDTWTTAQSVHVPSEYLGSIRPATDLDLYRFTVGTAGNYVLETFDESGTGCVGIDTVLTLHDAGGYPVATDDDRGVALCSRIAIDLYSGSYTLTVNSYANATIIPGYRLRLSIAPLT